MSRCASCNKIMSTQEMSIKGIYSGKYIDMCYRCCDQAEIDYEVDLSLQDADAPEEFDIEEEDQEKDYEI